MNFEEAKAKVIELNEAIKHNTISRPNAGYFSFCNNVKEGDYFRHIIIENEDGTFRVEKEMKLPKKDILYSGPQHTMSVGERNKWYSKFKPR